MWRLRVWLPSVRVSIMPSVVEISQVVTAGWQGCCNVTSRSRRPISPPIPKQGQVVAIRLLSHTRPLCVHLVHHTFTPNQPIRSTMKAAVRPGRPPNQPLVRHLSRFLTLCLYLSSLKCLSLILILSPCPLFHRLANITTFARAALRFPDCEHLDAHRSFPLSRMERGRGVRFRLGPGGEVSFGAVACPSTNRTRYNSRHSRHPLSSWRIPCPS